MLNSTVSPNKKKGKKGKEGLPIRGESILKGRQGDLTSGGSSPRGNKAPEFEGKKEKKEKPSGRGKTGQDQDLNNRMELGNVQKQFGEGEKRKGQGKK